MRNNPQRTKLDITKKKMHIKRLKRLRTRRLARILVQKARKKSQLKIRRKIQKFWERKQRHQVNLLARMERLKKIARARSPQIRPKEKRRILRASL